ncbi:RsmE family RNA methyltransferase [Leptospira sp. 2 VSF19]|uniref:Ribosomal RNA small subunit methyltransferase E n=1 Tax=Leptospira soteropolitanensis TaxID=2950025 RepID=A0AAW5VIS1_9LEPT|nr:RsmE family RNA methyltransferase [Leptospira soteropolitanensis]MCW7492287.1 RsmE family RNA methyltransferase [Leptospira soteropolitanensis]MCW7499869.1 RsmE family RNA methyltransferase [Leptospira soteropolitanensis]MCW7522120.1 RsmE family RNA methyltransferase [Leptospira soteropolitanensis]MCW7525974.1 RsmE family RNA methyltransferase [Leptospira soteropolitanensis]MCW7529912.1 RsmE family RNA methyltransferase [Leptospira soteropolitanensis]
MNWILVYERELQQNLFVNLTDQRHTHIQTVLKKKSEDQVQVVVPNLGNFLFKIKTISDSFTTLEKLSLLPETLKPLPIHTFFSLPRPQTGKKLLHLAGAYGVQSVFFYATETKNKEYWTSPVYTKETLSHLETGLSQTGNSRLPIVVRERTISWKFFLKDWDGKIFVLDREGIDFQSIIKTQTEFSNQSLFVFGPESGWKPEDLLFFRENNFPLISLGKINLRTEFAYSALLHQLFSIKN